MRCRAYWWCLEGHQLLGHSLARAAEKRTIRHAGAGLDGSGRTMLAPLRLLARARISRAGFDNLDGTSAGELGHRHGVRALTRAPRRSVVLAGLGADGIFATWALHDAARLANRLSRLNLLAGILVAAAAAHHPQDQHNAKTSEHSPRVRTVGRARKDYCPAGCNRARSAARHFSVSA